jgi:L-alanine-DL-glutamate epimerase-like enolase superfamily enzyme
LREDGHHRAGSRGETIHAISGVDVALWDIYGKSLGVQIHRLLSHGTADQDLQWLHIVIALLRVSAVWAVVRPWGESKGIRVAYAKQVRILRRTSPLQRPR